MGSARCNGCDAALPYKGRGRPPKWCKRCRNRQLAEKQRAYYEANKAEIAEKQRAYYEANKAEIAEKKRAYYEANKAEIAEKQRAYYEANKAEIAEKQRARSGRTCSQCSEHLHRPTSDGLCGFCREEAGLAA